MKQYIFSFSLLFILLYRSLACSSLVFNLGLGMLRCNCFLPFWWLNSWSCFVWLIDNADFRYSMLLHFLDMCSPLFSTVPSLSFTSHSSLIVLCEAPLISLYPLMFCNNFISLVLNICLVIFKNT